MARPIGIPASNIKSEIGNVYGRLTVVAEGGRDKFGRAQWLCRCSCGAEKIIVGFRLRRKNGTKSCGCIRIENTRNLKLLSVEERERREKEDRPCTKCGEIFPPEEFGLITRHHCKKCRAARQREWRAKDGKRKEGSSLLDLRINARKVQ